MGSKVCDIKDLLRPDYADLAKDYIALSDDGTDDWRANNHVFRAWEYVHTYAELRLKGDERLCDIGSENSIFPIWVKKRHPDLEVVCVDPAMHGRLAKRAVLHGADIDIRREFFGPQLGAFDCITCISVMEHVPTPIDMQLVKLMAHALKPGGVLIITADYGWQDVPWPLRTTNVIGGARMYGKKQIQERIIQPSGLELRVDCIEDAAFEYKALDNDCVNGIDPLYVNYTSVALVLEKV